jgi:hypothetical protein
MMTVMMVVVAAAMVVVVMEVATVVGWWSCFTFEGVFLEGRACNGFARTRKSSLLTANEAPARGNLFPALFLKGTGLRESRQM